MPSLYFLLFYFIIKMTRFFSLTGEVVKQVKVMLQRFKHDVRSAAVMLTIMMQLV